MNRLYNLDYLRGFTAFGIMIYHYLGWIYGNDKSDTFLGRFGIYGVSIFYVLSGLTLYHVYYDTMEFSKEDVFSFFKKRIFRIFPLLWFATIISILLSKQMPNFIDLFLSFSGLFGFIKWEAYFSTGAWSIGNELVFYVFFPIFMLFIKKFKPLMALLALTIFGFYWYFSFIKLHPGWTLAEQWKNYINPLNQVFLFLGGFLLGFFFKNLKINNSITISFLLFGIMLFTFYPVTGDPINIVTGKSRMVFTVCCFIICICFYKMTFKFPWFLHKPLTSLGEISYSVYLLHPIVWAITGIILEIFSKHVFQVTETTRLILSVISTLVSSYYVYEYFEKYFIKFGHINKQKSL